MKNQKRQNSKGYKGNKLTFCLFSFTFCLKVSLCNSKAIIANQKLSGLHLKYFSLLYSLLTLKYTDQRQVGIKDLITSK